MESAGRAAGDLAVTERLFRQVLSLPLYPEMPLDTLLRAQATNGLFGAVREIEAEIARRMGILRTGDPAGLPQAGPDHETLVLRGLATEEGGFILLLNGLLMWQTPPAAAPSARTDEPVVPEPALPAPSEW